jgi:hypothetical protein
MIWTESIPLATLASVATGLICLVLARALLHKLTARAEFEATLGEYRILPQSWTAVAAVCFVVLEAIAIVAIIAPASRQQGAILAAGLFSLYSLAMAINLLRGRDRIDCGCGGAGQHLSWFLVARNLLLVAGCVCIVTCDMPAMLGVAECIAAAGLVPLLWLLLALFDRILGNRSHERATSREA